MHLIRVKEPIFESFIKIGQSICKKMAVLHQNQCVRAQRAKHAHGRLIGNFSATVS